MNEELINQLNNYSVLCVEDEEIIRTGMVNTLKYYFKDVYEASNGDEAYDLYLQNKPDIILCDIQMPKINGIDFITKLRQKDRNTLVIMITAYSSEEYLMQLINLNINHYILKPLNSTNLLEGIIKAFGNRLNKHLFFSKDMYLDMKTYKLFYKKEEVLLRKRDIDFLLLLHENKNQIVPYSLIEDTLWRDKVMSSSALKTFVKEFRKRIPQDILINVQQIGYQLQISQ